jgi:D-alanyl-D-alanine carboxypeptidase-like protein
MDARARLILLRRTALAGGAAMVGVGALAPGPPAFADPTQGRVQASRRRSRVEVGRASRNGWPMEKGVGIGGQVWSRPLPGTGQSVDIRTGDVNVVLDRVVRRFHYEVMPLLTGSVVGYRSWREVGRGRESNHASGTAVDVLPDALPTGATGVLFSDQLEAVRAIVAECRGMVAWGGDFDVPAPSHFEIAVGPQDRRLAVLAEEFRARDASASATPGFTV